MVIKYCHSLAISRVFKQATLPFEFSSNPSSSISKNYINSLLTTFNLFIEISIENIYLSYLKSLFINFIQVHGLVKYFIVISKCVAASTETPLFAPSLNPTWQLMIFSCFSLNL